MDAEDTDEPNNEGHNFHTNRPPPVKRSKFEDFLDDECNTEFEKSEFDEYMCFRLQIKGIKNENIYNVKIN